MAPLKATIRNLKQVSTIDDLDMRRWAPGQRETERHFTKADV